MPRFKRVYVEITNICNLNCSFCHKTKREKEFISVENFRYIISSIKPFTNYIYMHIMGEPLLHPQLNQLLDICEEYKIKVNITTNGTLIHNVKNDIINKKSLRQINFSIHSFEDNNGIFDEKYLLDILDFAFKNKENIISCLRLWNIEENNDSNKHIVSIIENYFSLDRDYLTGITSGNGITLTKNIYFQQQKRFVWPDINREYEINSGMACFGLRDHLGILVNGDVVPCCLDCEGDIVLGNVYNQEFKDIFDCKRAKNIIEGFRKKQAVEKLCKTCGWNFNE